MPIHRKSPVLKRARTASGGASGVANAAGTMRAKSGELVLDADAFKHLSNENRDRLSGGGSLVPSLLDIASHARDRQYGAVSRHDTDTRARLRHSRAHASELKSKPRAHSLEDSCFSSRAVASSQAPGCQAASQCSTRSGHVFLQSRREGLTRRDSARAAAGKRSAPR